MINIVVTGVGSTTSISAIKAFRKQAEFDISIHGVDINPADQIAGSAFCDSFTQIPRASSPEYLDCLLQVCKAQQAVLLIPVVDEELVIIAGAAGRFQELGCRVACSPESTVRTCLDKYQCMELLSSHRVQTPHTRWASSIQSSDEIRFPAFAKPNRGRSSINALRVDSLEELQILQSKVPDLIVQELICGTEYTIDVMCNFEGRPFAVVPRQRIEIKSGITYKGRSLHCEQLTEIAVKITSTLQFAGPLNFQCIDGPQGMSCIEVNPRFSGTLPLTVESGVNGPLWLLRLLDGQQPPPGILPFQPVSMTRYWDEVFRHET